MMQLVSGQETSTHGKAVTYFTKFQHWNKVVNLAPIPPG